MRTITGPSYFRKNTIERKHSHIALLQTSDRRKLTVGQIASAVKQSLDRHILDEIRSVENILNCFIKQTSDRRKSTVSDIAY